MTRASQLGRQFVFTRSSSSRIPVSAVFLLPPLVCLVHYSKQGVFHNTSHARSIFAGSRRIEADQVDKDKDKDRKGKEDRFSSTSSAPASVTGSSTSLTVSRCETHARAKL